MLIQKIDTSFSERQNAPSLQIKKVSMLTKINRYLAKLCHNLNLSGWSQFK